LQFQSIYSQVVAAEKLSVAMKEGADSFHLS